MRREFDFIGGWLCLDFANGLEDVQRAEPSLYYEKLLRWSEEAGSLIGREARDLARIASGQPAAAQAVAGRAHRLAEVLRKIFVAIVDEKRPTKADVAVLNTELANALGKLSIIGAEDGFALDWPAKGTALDRVLWPVAQAAGHLLVSSDLDKLRACDSDSCVYLFVDTSKNGRRRWCDMKVCGNRHKARRFRQRQQRSRQRPRRPRSEAGQHRQRIAP